MQVYWKHHVNFFLFFMLTFEKRNSMRSLWQRVSASCQCSPPPRLLATALSGLTAGSPAQTHTQRSRRCKANGALWLPGSTSHYNIAHYAVLSVAIFFFSCFFLSVCLLRLRICKKKIQLSRQTPSFWPVKEPLAVHTRSSHDASSHSSQTQRWAVFSELVVSSNVKKKKKKYSSVATLPCLTVPFASKKIYLLIYLYGDKVLFILYYFIFFFCSYLIVFPFSKINMYQAREYNLLEH